MTALTVTHRFGRAAGIGAAGFAVAMAITMLDMSFRHDWGFVRCATAGAFLSGLIFAGAFGGEGPGGWFKAGLGFGGATVLGAMFAVALLPLDMALMRSDLLSGAWELPVSSMLGPVYVVGLIGDNMGVALSWLAGLVSVQLLAMRRARHCR